MRAIEQLLDEVAVLAGSDAGRTARLIAGCARNRVFAPGDALLREGEPADEFFVLRRGAVAVETDVPGRGAVTLETLRRQASCSAGPGWCRRTAAAFDARAVGTTRVHRHRRRLPARQVRRRPGARLRPAEASSRRVFVERLQATRLRLLDVYGAARGG